MVKSWISGKLRGINRIRLEFKVNTVFNKSFVAFLVLIESDWNLKDLSQLYKIDCMSVLIESDWNLKCRC